MKQYFAFQWHITDDCDQRCKHCYIFAENTCKQLDSMTWKQMQDVVANCEDFCEMYGRLPYFYITGGDPILHPDFWPLLELLAIKKIPFTLMGNPFHLTDEVCQRMKMLGCEKYQLSIDGLEQTHDWFRKPGSYQTTLEKIDTINQAGIRSVVMTTVSGTNIGEVPGIIDAVAEQEDGSLEIIDYKSGKPPKISGEDAIPRGYAWQLALYKMALDHLLRIGEKASFSKVAKASLHYLQDRSERTLPDNEYRQEILRLCREIAEKKTEEDFAVKTENCSFCPFAYMCKKER